MINNNYKYIIESNVRYVHRTVTVRLGLIVILMVCECLAINCWKRLSMMWKIMEIEEGVMDNSLDHTQPYPIIANCFYFTIYDHYYCLQDKT